MHPVLPPRPSDPACYSETVSPHLPSVVRALHEGNFLIRVRFEDGVEAVVDCEPFLQGPIFAPIRRPQLFRQFFLDGVAITWPNGAAISAADLYAAATGQDLLVDRPAARAAGSRLSDAMTAVGRRESGAGSPAHSDARADPGTMRDDRRPWPALVDVKSPAFTPAQADESAAAVDAATITSVVHISREYASLAGAGGVKDVTEGLCQALASRGVDTHVFLPGYRTLLEKLVLPAPAYTFAVPMAYPGQPNRTEHVNVYSVSPSASLTLHVVESDRYAFLEERNWTIPRHGIYNYTAGEAQALGHLDLTGKGYADFFAMNVLLVKASLLALGAMSLVPDVVHLHDGHAALFPLIAQNSTLEVDARLAHAATVLTIHNAGVGFHQEVGDLDFAAAVCGLPRNVIDAGMLNFAFDPLLAGGIGANVVTTVSENYARELASTTQDAATGWLGHRLRGNGVVLMGVTNGIDPTPYEPERGAEIGLVSAYSVRDGRLEGKEACKRGLLEALSRHDVPPPLLSHGTIDYAPERPLLTFVGRLDRQKGYDLLQTALLGVLGDEADLQVLGVGDGDPSVRDALIHLANSFPGRVAFVQGYNPAFANQIYAAGDFFAVPSRSEPCGLTDFIAQLMGNVPIVHAVGGLVKVIDGEFGLSYVGGVAELAATIRRALALYREPGRPDLRRLQQAAAHNVYEHFTWERVVDKKYMGIYERAVRRSQPALPYL